MTKPQEATCHVGITRMMSAFGLSTYSIGCEHRPLAIMTTVFADGYVFLTLLLEDKSVEMAFDRSGSARVIAELPPTYTDADYGKYHGH